MTVEQIRDKKLRLEDQIMFLIKDFEKETGCSLTKVSITKVKEEGFGLYTETETGVEINLCVEV